MNVAQTRAGTDFSACAGPQHACGEQPDGGGATAFAPMMSDENAGNWSDEVDCGLARLCDWRIAEAGTRWLELGSSVVDELQAPERRDQ